ncbi:MAG TPA: TatD family hydrolase [Syntrophobacteraceae bacterium]|nr:TatD family hydrolase [Syntrophobacteraceae bacterium]
MHKLPELIDTHAHLDFPEFVGIVPSVIERALQQAGVSTIVTIGIDIETSRKASQIAARYGGIYSSAGVHPHASFNMNDGDLHELEMILADGKVVAVGEIGLDYFRDRQPRPIQKGCMKRQLEMAVKTAKPVIFHIRNAWDDFFKIVPPFSSSLPPCVMHCFSGDWKVARRCLDLGFYLSIPGVVTFPKADSLQDVVKHAPLDRLLVETDSPFLAPVPYRGKINEPAFVLHTAKKIAECRKEPFEEVAARTTQNARAVFGIKT